MSPALPTDEDPRVYGPVYHSHPLTLSDFLSSLPLHVLYGVMGDRVRRRRAPKKLEGGMICSGEDLFIFMIAYGPIATEKEKQHVDD